MFLFADDVAFISDTVVGLHNQLNLLYGFCECRQVSVNVKKLRLLYLKRWSSV